MELPKSSLSKVCRAIADYVGEGLEAHANSIRVMIGSPASAAPAQNDTDHRLNFFYYLIEPAGFFTGNTPGDPWWLRLQCLITGFGIAEDKISAGENDLRLLGEVMRLFHETPILPALTVDDETFLLQVVFLPLHPDDLNHIWSTQGEVSYRPSVAYEMSLAPVIPKKRRPGSPLVGRLGAEVRTFASPRSAPFAGEILAPPVPLSKVDAALPGWAPVVCLVHESQCALSLAFLKGSQALADFTPQVWVAGAPGAAVTLRWQRWTSASGWQEVAATTPATATAATLDPDKVGEAVTQAVDLPADFAAQGGQAVLYAERKYQRGSDGVEITVKSNPLLVTVYGGA